MKLFMEDHIDRLCAGLNQERLFDWSRVGTGNDKEDKGDP